VLVVDDEPPLVRIVSYLEREGFEVVAAVDGEQAVEQARRNRPDVIVLYLMLPGIDGIEACRRRQEGSDAVPIRRVGTWSWNRPAARRGSRTDWST
jgi:two-component system alkaline phosphatase synthesis response regulator PhoP